MLKVTGRISLLTIGFLMMVAPIGAQPAGSLSGRWVWKEVARRNQVTRPERPY